MTATYDVSAAGCQCLANNSSQGKQSGFELVAGIHTIVAHIQKRNNVCVTASAKQHTANRFKHELANL
jgi:hypothetical protein